MFKAGDKVICVRGKSNNSQVANHFYPVQGKIYTVASVESDEDYNCFYVSLVEDTFNGASWDLDRFISVGEVSAGLVPTDLAITQPNALGGIKFDQGKVDYTYLLKDLPVSVEEVTKVLIYGANKYSRSNYSKVESERYEAAALRHIMAYLQGEQLDPETGYHHLAHATCCLMFLVERKVEVAK